MGLLPAHAGVVPALIAPEQSYPAAPRARGGGPSACSRTTCASRCSPRTRGWSPGDLDRDAAGGLLPAHAGVVPPRPGSSFGHHPAPRARGGGPRAGTPKAANARCSPRTRGWSPQPDGARRHAPLLPAHAGVVPRAPTCGQTVHAAPRARGGGPRSRKSASTSPACSPRTRGWSQRGRRLLLQPGLLPAHAGVVPARTTPASTARPAPRARGGGPVIDSNAPLTRDCSPRTRGWSQLDAVADLDRHLLPAHAGVVP